MKSIVAKKNNKNKKIMSAEKIYKIMQWLPIAVAIVFLLINVIKKNWSSALVIGAMLVVFLAIIKFMQIRKMSLYVQEFVVSIAVPLFVFFISLNSGESYSDDFCMHLAVIALTGLYLEPKFTRVQIVLANILFVLMYILHPEKAEVLSQYIMNMAIFTLAAVIDYLMIKRGRGFIEMSDVRAAEAEELLGSIRDMGAELQNDFAVSSVKIQESTEGLQQGSASITAGAGAVSETCGVALGTVQDVGEQIDRLNEGVKAFEMALADNRKNVEAMNTQVNAVGGIIAESANVFRAMEQQMQGIAGIAKEINDISFKLTILSLNASVEAAQAGEYGAGFEVLATEMRALSESSGQFTEQVSDAVKAMLKNVAKTSERFMESEAAMQQSEETMSELAESFGRLNGQFGILYENIARQTDSVSQMEQIFAGLNGRAADMYNSSMANQEAVDAIAEAMGEFRENVGRIVENTQKV